MNALTADRPAAAMPRFRDAGCVRPLPQDPRQVISASFLALAAWREQGFTTRSGHSQRILPPPRAQ